jgi:hypothetical protein
MPIETVVHLAAEPAEFTLVTTADLPDTTNSGHLILPRRFASSPEREQVAAFCQSSTERLITNRTLNAKLRTNTTAVAPITMDRRMPRQQARTGSSGQARFSCHCWLAPPLAVHCTTCAPSLVDAPLTSAASPLSWLMMV